MRNLAYYRPGTIEEALELLGRGIPLAGGTRLTPRLDDVDAVIDLQDLGLDWIEVGEKATRIGAMVSLQRLLEADAPIHPALLDCCRREAGWNLRNVATIGGTITVGDGRSPLLAALLAVDTRITLQPGERELPIDQYLQVRESEAGERLVTAIEVPSPRAFAYEQVARSPADRPIVSAAVALLDRGDERETRAVLGGWGARPLLVGAESGEGLADEARRSLAQAGSRAYAVAGDEWASEEFRARVAERLLARLIAEVLET